MWEKEKKAEDAKTQVEEEKKEDETQKEEIILSNNQILNICR